MSGYQPKPPERTDMRPTNPPQGGTAVVAPQQASPGYWDSSAGAILSDTEIQREIRRGEIVVNPMAPLAVGTNSIDLHLAPVLLRYKIGELLRTDKEVPVQEEKISARGKVLWPNELYLGSTVEWTSSGSYVPILDGTSGAGRLGISVHQTAGIGDVGFEGHWTLEITVIRPVLVFGGEPLAQLRFFRVQGRVAVPYRQKVAPSYADAQGAGPVPQPSRMWKKKRWLGRSEGDKLTK